MNAGQTVTRTAKNRGSRFARIDNAVLQDPRLSFRARGVFAFVLSRPGTWQHSAESLCRGSNEGLHAVRSALRELTQFGYARLITARAAHGHVVNRWHFSEQPSAEIPHPVNGSPDTDFQDTAPSTHLPGAGQPASGQPASGKTAPYETTVGETTESETTGGCAAHAGPTPVLFPWSEVTDMPDHLRERLRDRCHHHGDYAFTLIRGKKLRFHDKHPLADWPAVMASEIDAARECGEFDRPRASKDGACAPAPERTDALIPEPERRREWMRANMIDPSSADREWSDLPLAVRRIVVRDMNAATSDHGAGDCMQP